MPVRYKIDVLAALKDAGYTTYKLRRDKLLGESVIQQLRDAALVSWPNIGRLCQLLNCQPGDIVKYVSETVPSTDSIPISPKPSKATKEPQEGTE